jgi:hypothetical protein
MTSKLAIKIMLWLITIITLFHLAILTKIIPYEITWGGRLENDSEMYVFETISIIFNIFLGLVLFIKDERLPALIPMKVINIILWVFLILFSLNTIGNIFAETLFEKILAIVTLSFSYLIFIIFRNTQNLNCIKRSLTNTLQPITNN